MSYVRDFRLGSADFFLWESFRLGSADFFIRGITHLLDCHWFYSVLRRLVLRKSHNDREFEIRCRRSTEELSTGPGKQNMILLVQRLHSKFAAGTEIMPLPTRRIV